MLITIDESIARELVSFIRPRCNIPYETESVIVEKQRNFFVSKLVGKSFDNTKSERLIWLLRKKYYEMLMHPGETVGIICGQCIGECTTQSSLNNFHSAGLDTGVETQIDHLQNIINASKFKTNETRKKFKLKLYFNSSSITSVRDAMELVKHDLNEVLLLDLVESVDFAVCDEQTRTMYNVFCPVNTVSWHKEALLIKLSLQKIYKHRIGVQKLVKIIDAVVEEFGQIVCLPYALLDEDEETYKIFVYHPDKFIVYKKLQYQKVVGITGVRHSEFKKDVTTGEWYVECLCNNLSAFMYHSDIYDINRLMCSSMHDVCKTFGVLMSYETIVQKCAEIIPSVDKGYFNILAMRMTKNGVLEPLTRYTMRNNVSPLAKASFEESFETFIKACKFNETEKFTSISSKIICGKKPRIGTYLNDVIVDTSFYLKQH